MMLQTAFNSSRRGLSTVAASVVAGGEIPVSPSGVVVADAQVGEDLIFVPFGVANLSIVFPKFRPMSYRHRFQPFLLSVME
jgi:hypothetical protein